ncbi:MAG TPA: pilus assembly protein PilP [Syntrophales bacterium]|nr:pilus assembly protein PilP [Syntrophales bacterium]
MEKTRNDSLKSSYLALSLILALLLLISGGLWRGAFATTSGDEKAPPPADYHYNPTGKPDPFLPFVEKEIALKKKMEKTNIASIFPLQREGIDQFNLVGIAGDEERRFAVVETKDSKSRFYPVAVGTVIGLNNGKVVEIKRDVIVIEEVTMGRTGRKINRITKRLRIDEEGTQ